MSLFGVTAHAERYRGRSALQLFASTAGKITGHIGTEAFVKGIDSHDGTIEVWVAGDVAPTSTDTNARG